METFGAVFNVIPNRQPKYNAVFVSLSPSCTLYQAVGQRMNSINDLRIISMKKIKISHLEEMYKNIKKTNW